jgi:hypothetical protein
MNFFVLAVYQLVLVLREGVILGAIFLNFQQTINLLASCKPRKAYAFVQVVLATDVFACLALLNL